MKVFISWSGDRSKAVAEVLDEWLQCVLQAVDPWLSSKDIDRGSLWFSEISNQLADTKLGIVCLTQDNKTNPWILFEAGALAKGISSSRVCTFLIDLKSTDVANPLAQFNHTIPTREGVYGLLRTINSCLGDRTLEEKILERIFETYWPQFEKEFEKALNENQPTEKIEPRSEENMLLEVLTSVRRLDRRMREVESSRANQNLSLFERENSDEIESNMRAAERRHANGMIATKYSKRARAMIHDMLTAGVPKGLMIKKLRNEGFPDFAINQVLNEVEILCPDDSEDPAS